MVTVSLRLYGLIANMSVAEADTYVVETVIPAPTARYGEAATCYVGLRREGSL
jgi:hypothetical protein